MPAALATNRIRLGALAVSPFEMHPMDELAAMLEEAGRGWFTRNDAHLGAAADELKNLIRQDPDFGDAYRANSRHS